MKSADKQDKTYYGRGNHSVHQLENIVEYLQERLHEDEVSKAVREFDFIEADYTDDNGIQHIDGYYPDSDQGFVIGYIFNNRVYYTNPEFRFNPFVVDFIKNELKLEP